jgi:hypothetical protein
VAGDLLGHRLLRGTGKSVTLDPSSAHAHTTPPPELAVDRRGRGGITPTVAAQVGAVRVLPTLPPIDGASRAPLVEDSLTEASGGRPPVRLQRTGQTPRLTETPGGCDLNRLE